MNTPSNKTVNIINLYEFSESIFELKCATPKFANNDARNTITIDSNMF